ncbi:hypothetical protein J4U00_gp122 [Mycobacterium phage DyoEdafos]|uniref:Uncharacterized protein n=1 Tax=Mycobacterium phage DyoEdafos TaxID=2599860 RepID=A0A5J6TI35_9CAUD|nr:hypothetical protein J4U00_gp122 [Mycobacterium phage DyoEdafos]QFG10375.1 hypothetical protein SEA_DYOEDAFOS_147 [Mycobacterium phage DyoEdafos]
MLAWHEQAQAIWRVVLASLYFGGTPVVALHPTLPPRVGLTLPGQD